MAEPSRLAPPLEDDAGTLRNGDLVTLMHWLSPAFPVGAFAYSHGLEWAAREGVITDRESLGQWIGDLLQHGSGWNDAVLFAESHRAAAARDGEGLAALADLARAMAPSKERALETLAQGEAFLAHMAPWPSAALGLLAENAGGPVAYPVAVAAATAGRGIALEAALSAYLQAFAVNLVAAALRLMPLGQSEGVAALAGLCDIVLAVARRAARSGLNDLGSATMASDIAAMAHETQYSRVFRS